MPLTDREVDHLAGQLKPLVVPDLVVFAEREGEPIGFAAAVPDFNVALRANPSGRLFPGILKVLWASRRITRLRVMLLGVLPEWQGRGVDALLYRHIWENGRAKGYDWAEAGWILEDNHADDQRPDPHGLRGLQDLPRLREADLRAAVTGATGFVGSHLVEALVARGDAVTALVRRPATSGGAAGARLPRRRGHARGRGRGARARGGRRRRLPRGGPRGRTVGGRVPPREPGRGGGPGQSVRASRGLLASCSSRPSR